MDLVTYRFCYWRPQRGGGGGGGTDCENCEEDEQQFIDVRVRFNFEGRFEGDRKRREGLKVFKNPLLGVMPQSHKSNLKNLVLCDDGNLLFSCSRDGRVLAWDTRTRIQKSLNLQIGLADCIIASEDSSLVVASHINPIRIISLTQEKPSTESLPFSTGSKLVKFSKQFDYLSSYSKQSHISLWNFKTRQHLKDITIGDHSIVTMTFTYDNKHILVLTEEEDLIMIELDSGKYETTTKTSLVYIATGNESNIIATASDKSIITLKSDKMTRNFDSGHISHVNFIQFNGSDSNLITSSYDKTLKIFKLDDPIELLQIIKCESTALAHAINHDFSLIYLGVEASSGKNAIRVFDRKMGRFEDGFEGHYSDISDVIVLKDLIHILTDARDGAFRIWDRNSGKMVKRVEISRNFSDFVISENERMIAYVLNEYLYIWDLDNDKEIFKVSIEYFSLVSIFFINHDKYIVLNQSSSLSFVLVERQNIVRTLKFNHYFEQSSVKVDERFFLQNFNKGSFRFWEVGENQNKLLDIKLARNTDILAAIFDKTRKYLILTTLMKEFVVIRHNFSL